MSSETKVSAKEEKVCKNYEATVGRLFSVEKARLSKQDE